jgi:hypothetical protein
MGFFTRITPALRQLKQWWYGTVDSVAPDAAPQPRAAYNTGNPEAHPSPAQPSMAPRTCLPKLRTICTSDGALGQHSRAVRVVISGRMADVCAELDRLIALETQPTLN